MNLFQRWYLDLTMWLAYRKRQRKIDADAMRLVDIGAAWAKAHEDQRQRLDHRRRLDVIVKGRDQ